MKIRGFWGCFFLFLAPLAAHAQSIDRELKKAESLQRSYDFESAESSYKLLEGQCTDSATVSMLRELEVQCENGKSFLQYALNPTVINAKTVSRRDFFLYYSHLGDSVWMYLPNSFVSQSSAPVVSASYLPKGASRYIFSAPDKSGSWNLNVTVFGGDSLWSSPELMNEDNTSPGNEILPLMSPDGKYLYFSSDGLFGMGGYDLYRCEWDDDNKDWGVPENLGFPYSSPADDFLYSDTPDGKYSIFASNRDCSPDSMRIYVLSYEVMPVKQSLTDLSEVRRIARLDPSSASIASDSSNLSLPSANAPSSDKQPAADSIESANAAYFSALSEMRKQEKQISALEALQKKDRDDYIALADDDPARSALEQKLLDDENKLMTMQQDISGIRAKIQGMEMDFLSKGMTFNTIDIHNEDTNKKAPASSPSSRDTYSFKRMAPAGNRAFRIRPKKEAFDYSFKIGDVAHFAPKDSIPSGIIYQIHVFNAPAKYPVKKLKGLSPVFKRKLTGDKYDYSVGIFHSYNEVLEHLNEVKKLGFKDASIIAFEDGNTLAVTRARKKETERKTTDSYKIVLSGYSDGMPSDVRTTILSNSRRDITKQVENDAAVYVIAPFSTRESADSLVNVLISTGIKDLKVEKLN